jgi:2'-5' RNA ligase
MKGYADYLIILSPPDEIAGQVEKHKQDAAGIIGTYDSLHSKAHISIKPMPRRRPYMAEPEINGLKASMKLLPPVTLTIDGFDFFSHGDEYRTLYAKIRSAQYTTHWFKALKKNLNIKDYLVPHITVARNIHKNDFDRLWPHFKKIKWVEDFEINKLTVLHREALNTFAHWEVFTELPFEAKHLVSEAPPKQSLLKPLHGNYSANQQTSLF